MSELTHEEIRAYLIAELNKAYFAYLEEVFQEDMNGHGDGDLVEIWDKKYYLQK